MRSAADGHRLDVLDFVLRHEPPQWDLDVALSVAARRRGSAAFVRTLLAAGARPISERWVFPLWNAATAGDADTVRLLLEAGADPDARADAHPDSPDGCCRPLVGAVRADAHAVVAALLDGGADPNVLTDALRRPLDIAMETGSTAMAELLSARGATVFAPEEADLVQATRRGFLPRVRELLPTQEPATQGRALIVAVQERQFDIAVEILGHGEVGPDDLAMALGQAIALNAPQVVPHLIAAGVDPDAPGNVYRTPPIVLAADRGHAQVVRDLLDAGADSQARDLDGRDALAAARERDRTEVVRLLGTAGGTARTPREITQAAKAKLAHVARLTWSPLLGAADGNGEPGASRFGGLPWLGAEEPWPLCADCAAPLTFFVQLDLAAVPEKARNLGTGLLQLFHCTACNPFRAFSGGHLVRIVEVAGEAPRPTPPDGVRRFPERPIAGWARAVRDYPYREADEPELLPEERAVVFGLNRQGDKLGGWPNWVQDAGYPNCPRGDGRMTQLVMQIDSRRGVPHMWGDNGAGYIVQCPAHRDQVAFLWQSA
ncbi:ankyrin repeat domain-containing protein [Streptomyces sp. MS19]|uniref:ankyrin repeat domain-containing protein n=1 Tax=Streptomyces sp. MS19 TaxID=3385972 RepID=UPI0039A0848C